MNDQDVVIGDEVTVSWSLKGRPLFGGQPASLPTTLHGFVTAIDQEALSVIADRSEPPTRIPRATISRIELVGLNPHRLDPRSQPVLVRVYPGHRQSDAAATYEDEAVLAVRAGYLPVAHSWAPGEPGIGRVLAIGVLGAVAMRPEGALVVTYVHRSSGRLE